MEYSNKKHFTGIVLLGLIVAAAYYSYTNLQTLDSWSHPVEHSDTPEKVHVHSDFLLYLAGTQYDLTDDKYQSSGLGTKHAHIHLHDNNDDVVHRHDHDVSLVTFMNSLGFTLTNTCIITDIGDSFCSDQTNTLVLLVNGERVEDISTYVNQEEDQILLFYGESNDPRLTDLQAQITDESCRYSGTCPERGTPPPEACGLTCEL